MRRPAFRPSPLEYSLRVLAFLFAPRSTIENRRERTKAHIKAKTSTEQQCLFLPFVRRPAFSPSFSRCSCAILSLFLLQEAVQDIGEEERTGAQRHQNDIGTMFCVSALCACSRFLPFFSGTSSRILQFLFSPRTITEYRRKRRKGAHRERSDLIMMMSFSALCA